MNLICFYNKIIMTEKIIDSNNPVLRFEGKQYNINDLANDAKEIIKELQIAEAQLKMHEDTLKLLNIGRKALANELRGKLKNYE